MMNDEPSNDEPTTAKLLSISQAADLLGVHPNTLRKWADDGFVPHVKFPGSGYRRFEPAAIERFAQGMRQEWLGLAQPERTTTTDDNPTGEGGAP